LPKLQNHFRQKWVQSRAGNVIPGTLAGEADEPSQKGYPVGITCRRLILAACVAVVALGAVWWASADVLTPDEQLLSGRWRFGPTDYGGDGNWEFLPDRQTVLASGYPSPSGLYLGYRVSGRWSMRDGVIRIDTEPSPARRVLRPVAAKLQIRAGRVNSYAVTSVTADRLVIGYPDGGSARFGAGIPAGAA
jgi:hypothetical protein